VFDDRIVAHVSPRCVLEQSEVRPDAHRAEPDVEIRERHPHQAEPGA
jgi:hypothetical protein